MSNSESSGELPRLKMQLGEYGEFEATPENTSVFTFLGQTAINGIMWDNERFNHAFLNIHEVDEDRVQGAYIFSDAKNFDEMMRFFMQNGYPLHVNLRHVAQCDIDAYFAHQEVVADRELKDMDDTIKKLLEG